MKSVVRPVVARAAATAGKSQVNAEREADERAPASLSSAQTGFGLTEVSSELDHGYEVDQNVLCRAVTKKERRCTLPALLGIDLCALHSGLARPRGTIGYGDPKALEAYKRGMAVGARPARARSP